MRRVALVLAACLSCAVAARTSGETQSCLFDALTCVRVASVLATVARVQPDSPERVRKRLVAVSNSFVGRPFAWNPVGEANGGLDPDPLLTLSSFDCGTFVETMLALARATSATEVGDQIVVLRYSGREPRFANRNHFAGAEWLPEAVRNGALRPITREVAGPLRVETVSATADRERWRTSLPDQPAYRDLFLGEHRQVAWEELRSISFEPSEVTAVIEYLPFSAFGPEDGTLGPEGATRTVFDRIPSGSVLMVVRPASPYLVKAGVNELVAHLGLAVRKRNALLIRAASPTPKNAVYERPVTDYIQWSQKADGPKGLIVLEPLPSSAATRTARTRSRGAGR